MDIGAWATISRLLDEALDLPPSEREAWLSRVAGAHPELAPRLQAMLDRAGTNQDGFLAELPRLTALDDAAGLRLVHGAPGDLVGAYRLIREIASGGQGTVWLAERADGLLARPVALKLPIGLALRPHLARRMAREREILASLTHPQIARLYDAGLADDGAPFLAMEFVDGTTIDRHCTERGLDVAARVRLFVPVIRAVAFAHGRLVIHRDLKPSNILVTADGEVRLLDFGIAKLLDEARPADSTLTEDAGRALTLRYASPEQVAQQPLGVATDIYSLGVVLYELLTGHPPYQPTRDTVAALEEAVLSADPVRPSEAAADSAARRALAGDLDTILNKALKKAPGERYATAGDLADDLTRHLDGHPVVAQPDRTSYRVRKFVGRHRVETAAAAAALLLVFGAAGAALWQARVARAERDSARQQQARAEASSDFLQSLLIQAGPDRPLTATELLDRGTKQLAAATDLDDDVLAFLQYEISGHYARFNQTDRELELLTGSAERARRAGDPTIAAAADCSAAFVLAQRDLPAAKVRLEAGEAVLAGTPGAGFNARADCLKGRARVLEMDGRIPEATTLLEREIPRLGPSTPQTWSRLQFLKTVLSDYYRRAERYADALVLSEENLTAVLARGQAGTLSELVARNNLAGNLQRLGEVQRAHEIYLDLLTWIGGDVLPVPPLSMRINIGVSFERMGDARRALDLAGEERLAAVQAGNATTVAIADLIAARALLALGRRDEAQSALDAAFRFWRTNPQGYVRMLVEGRMAAAELLAASGRLQAALDGADQLKADLGYPARRTAAGLERALRLSAKLRLLAGDPAGALEDASGALDLAEHTARDPRASADVGDAALLRARALAALGRADDATRDARLAVDALTAGYGAAHRATADALALQVALGRPGPRP